ncbi:MAG: hypothetical protein ABL998_07375 [Planctomycetota bacterium]
MRSRLFVASSALLLIASCPPDEPGPLPIAYSALAGGLAPAPDGVPVALVELDALGNPGV